MHEGIRCYLHWKNGYTPLYACCADMPAETFLVYEFCLSCESVKDSSVDLERLHAEAEGTFHRYGFFNMVDGTHDHMRRR